MAPRLAASAVAHLSGSPTVPWPFVWDYWHLLSFTLPDQPPPPDRLETHLIWVDSIKVIPLACCRMSLECLVGTRKFPTTLVTLSLQFRTRLVLHWCIKSKASVLVRAFMHYSACWRSKKALVSIRCLTINTRANRVAIVYSVIARIFNPMQVLGSHISTLSNKDTCDLFCVVNNARSQLLWCIIVQLLFIFCSTFMQCLFDEIILFDLILLFSIHVHLVNIQFWSWIVFQVFRSR
jgi:hypothetical protein